MLHDFISSLRCVREDEAADYSVILRAWQGRNCHVALMPAISWHGGTYNLFDRKAGGAGENMIWIIPGGQAGFFWLPELKREISAFYEQDEVPFGNNSRFPGIDAEEFEEVILLHSDDIQDDPEKTVLGANVLLIRLTLLSGRETLLFLLLEHQDICWKNIVEGYQIPLTWFVDSGRGTEDYFVRVKLYQLMKQSSCPALLPPLYFKGLYNKGDVPEGFRFLYAMLSEPEADGYDPWQTFSAVYEANWQGASEPAEE